jgi:hypothetical protein
MKTEIRLGRVNVTAVQNNAGVLYGDNTLKGWQSRTKSNTVLGRINGNHNIIASRLNYLNDPDFVDMFVKTTGES